MEREGEDYILLVEDNEDDVILNQRAFRECGVRARLEVVRDGAEALEFLHGTGRHAGRDPARVPRLILLDLNLPKLSGHDVLRRVRSDPRTCLVPVVILTTSNDRTDTLRGYQEGTNSYICKPVDFARFDGIVRQLGQYWLELNVPPPPGVGDTGPEPGGLKALEGVGD